MLDFANVWGFFGGQAWDANFEKVYDLAWLVVQRNVASMCPG